VLIHHYEVPIGIMKTEPPPTEVGGFKPDFWKMKWSWPLLSEATFLYVHINALVLKLSLKLADIIKRINVFSAGIPAGIKGKNVVFKHTLKETNQSIRLFQNQLITLYGTAKNYEVKGFIKVL
jgi:hypothetical protein